MANLCLPSLKSEIVAYVWGKRDLKIVKRLRVKLQTLGVTCAVIASDTWDSFVTGFKSFVQTPTVRIVVTPT